MDVQSYGREEIHTPEELARFDAEFEQACLHAREITAHVQLLRNASAMDAPPMPFLTVLVHLMDIIVLEWMQAESLRVAHPSIEDIFAKHKLITPDWLAVRRRRQIKERTQ